MGARPIGSGGLLLLALLSPSLGGCIAGPAIVAGLSLNQISTAVSIVTIAATGKGPSEHALSAVVDGDCRFLEGLMREDRDICEAHGSAATKDDFHGLASLLDPPPEPESYQSWLARLNGQDSSVLLGLFGPPVDMRPQPSGVVEVTFAEVTDSSVCETRFDVGPSGHILEGSYQGESCRPPTPVQSL